MEGNGIVASVVRSGSVWRSASGRSAASEVFSRSSRDENDEEALKWAALEKLPTYDRIRKGILTGSTGEGRSVDVEGLPLMERKKLMERLVRVAEEDNERFLLKLKNRLDRYASLAKLFPVLLS